MGQLLSFATRSRATPVPGERTDYEDGEDCEVHRFSTQTGAFFGSHFLMGGERYEVAKPEAFLFGDSTDLCLLSNKPAQFPYSRQPVTDPVQTLNALVNVRRDSVKFMKVKNEGEEGRDLYYLEFFFDCDSACCVQIHFCAKEVICDGHVQFVYKYPNMSPSEQYIFDVGAEQQFNQFIFDPSLYDIPNMRYESGPYFPVVIEVCTVDCGVEQVQTTMASIERSADQSASLVLKPLKQKLMADGVVYLLQEIYGIENKEHDLSDENGSECIICMSDIRDTVILPCRHLCICNGCADSLRYKLNNCPICRSPFRALLQLKTMRVVSTVSITDQSSSLQQTRSQTRYETMTLVEALNGPISHIQSCVVPTAPLACDVEPPFEMSASRSSNRRPSKNCINIQQVLTLNSPAQDTDENSVYIEMKQQGEFANDPDGDADASEASKRSSWSRASSSHSLHSRRSAADEEACEAPSREWFLSERLRANSPSEPREEQALSTPAVRAASSSRSSQSSHCQPDAY